ncbi:MAG: cell division protein FtsA [Prevotellaceae bacterium]|jgi:cell division protein FtsA|nr:cell division protein FtsA [Prevotellaceae bacterium]
MEKYITAIDFGTTKIRALIGKKNASGKFHIIAHHEDDAEGVVQGEVENILQAGNVLKSILNDLRAQLEKIESPSSVDFMKVVYAGIGNIRYIKEKISELRETPEDVISKQEVDTLRQKMHHVQLNENEKILDIIPQRYCVDGRTTAEPVGCTGHRLEAEFHVFIGSKSQNNVRRSMEHAEIALKDVVLSNIAAAEAVLHKEEKETGVAVVNFGGGTTNLVVYHGGILRHTAVIPFGGNDITEDIRQGCRIIQRHAEQLKVQHGSCYSDMVKRNVTITVPGIGGGEAREVSQKTLANIIEARVAEITEAVLYEMQHSGYDGCLDAGMVITGGGAHLGDIVEYMKYKTGMEVRKGEPLYLISAPSCANVNYATAAGLLLKGMEAEERIPELVLVAPENEPRRRSLFGRNNPTKKTLTPEREPKPKQEEARTKPVEKQWMGGLFDKVSDFIDKTFTDDIA